MRTKIIMALSGGLVFCVMSFANTDDDYSFDSVIDNEDLEEYNGGLEKVTFINNDSIYESYNNFGKVTHIKYEEEEIADEYIGLDNEYEETPEVEVKKSPNKISSNAKKSNVVEKNQCEGKKCNQVISIEEKKETDAQREMKEEEILQKAREIEERRNGSSGKSFLSTIRKNIYFGIGVEYGHFTAKDKIKSSARKYTWNEQRVDYNSVTSSSFQTPKRDTEGKILYNSTTGAIEFDSIPNPKDDSTIKSFYNEDGTVIPGQENALKVALKDYIEDKILTNPDDPYTNISHAGLMLEYGADERYYFQGTGTPYNGQYWGQNEDGTYGAQTDGNANQAGQFYFGQSENDNEPLTYLDGLGTLENLQWKNLIFTSENNTNRGPHVTLFQTIGDSAEQGYKGVIRLDSNSGQSGMYNTMYSSRYNENLDDSFEKEKELPAISDELKSTKPAMGVTALVGYQITTEPVHIACEFSFGYSNSNVTVIKHDEPTHKETDFCSGNVNYVDKTQEITSPVDGSSLGKVYDETAGTIQPLKNSGLGRMTGAVKKSLTDFKTPYDVKIKKGISFSFTPIIGYRKDNALFYLSCGVTLNKYKVSIIPNKTALDEYDSLVPVGYLNGYMEDLTGKTFLHKYKRKLKDGSTNEYVDVNDTYRFHPSAIMEQNSDGEVNTFNGLRMNYPHYRDGGISLVGEESERPWIDSKKVSESKIRKAKKKNVINFEPGVGVRLYLSKSGAFIDFRYSCQFGTTLRMKHPEFAYFPMHIGRSDMKHKIKISGHKVRVCFGASL